MKLIISPAKSLDYKTPLPTAKHSEPQFIAQAQQLNETLNAKSVSEIAALMKLSDKLAQLNKDRYQSFSTPFTPQNSRPAAFAFNGDVYQGLDAFSIDQKHYDTFQNTVRILSGMYGILKPFDLLQPYRLEMGTKLKIKNAENLYQYWGSSLSEALNNELTDNEPLINLASNEYSKAVQLKNIKTPVITPVFKDFKNGKLKVISFFAKKARGLMARYIVENNITNIAELKAFNSNNYLFSAEHSNLDKGELVFTR